MSIMMKTTIISWIGKTEFRSEYCAIVDWEVKENTETVVVPLVDVRKGMKK